MHPHLAEVMAEARFEEGACGQIKWLPGAEITDKIVRHSLLSWGGR
jgi:hypothetical protein